MVLNFLAHIINLIEHIYQIHHLKEYKIDYGNLEIIKI